jgi:hypothetical protein
LDRIKPIFEDIVSRGWMFPFPENGAVSSFGACAGDIPDQYRPMLLTAGRAARVAFQ